MPHDHDLVARRLGDVGRTEVRIDQLGELERDLGRRVYNLRAAVEGGGADRDRGGVSIHRHLPDRGGYGRTSQGEQLRRRRR